MKFTVDFQGLQKSFQLMDLEGFFLSFILYAHICTYLFLKFLSKFNVNLNIQ